MGKYEVFTPEMEFPEGMTDYQASAIAYANEMRRFAYEFEYQMERDIDSWVEDAKRLIEDGEVTARELVEEAFDMFWTDSTDFESYFCEAVERFK